MLLFFGILISICVLTSALFFVAIYVGYKRIPSYKLETEHLPDVSVIVAAHNESMNIPSLLEALSFQTYPSSRIHVIIADDRSTDRTAEISQSPLLSALQVRFIRILEVPAGVSPKKHALDIAIRSADTEILLFTDADCNPEPMWIEKMVASFQAGSDVVLGVSPMKKGKTFASNYARYETNRTAMQYIAASSLGAPYMAVGRNWGYKKRLYISINGLRPLFKHLSGDDDLLLQRFASYGAKISVCADSGSFCWTNPPENFRDLVRQKLRHYSVSKLYNRPALFMLTVFAVTEFVSLICSPLILRFFADMSWGTILMLWAGKIFIDTRFLYPLFIRSDLDHLPNIFLEFFHVIFSSIVGFVALFVKPRW